MDTITKELDQEIRSTTGARPWVDPPPAVLTEDPERQPDGVSHGVIGFTALFLPMFAILVIAMLNTRQATVQVAAALLLLIGFSVFVRAMRDKADRESNHEHPSR